MKKRYFNFKFLTALVLLAFFALPAVTGQATLMHSYTFEDGTASDVVGTADGTLNGTGYTVTNGAYTSTTDGDFISFDGTALALNTYTAITMEAYVRAGDGTNPGWTVLAYFGGSAGSNAHFMTIARNDNRSQTEYVNGATAIGPELEDGKLHHLVSVLTATDLSFYIDGELIATDDNTKSLADISLENAWLGKGGWPDPTWNGSIYEFNIYEGALDAATITTNSTAFLAASDARLSDLTTDVGTLTPAFSSLTTHYAVAVPDGTTSVTVTPTANASGATVTGGGAVDVSAGPATATIEVTSEDGTESMTYTVDILVGIDENCFTPLYDDRTNMIPDPEMTDVTQYQGWGHKSIAYGHETYCGLSVMKFDAVTNSWPDGAAMDVNDIVWNANSAYRVRFMYKTMDGSLGLLANLTDPNFLMPLPATEGAWMEIDTVFHTGASPGTSFLSINNVDASSTAKAAYIDNYELYEVSMNTELSDLTVDGTTVTGFDAATMSYDVVLPDFNVPVVIGTPVAAYATTEITDAGNVPGSTTVEVIAEDGTTTATYTINFTGPATLMHSYTFEDGTASDVVGTVDGTLNGTGYTVADGAFTSTTDGDFISFDAAALALNTYSAITMEAYVLTGDGTNPGWTVLAYFGGTDGANAHFMSIARGDDRSQTEYVGGATAIGPELDDGKLHHLVSVLTATDISFYIDGELMETVAHTKSLSEINLENAWLGKGGWAADPTWNGSIYEFNIYEGALDPSSVWNNASAFLSEVDARLSALTTDPGTLTPEFSSLTTHYAIAVPDGTTSVNVTPTANASGATVTGGGAVDISAGPATSTIDVTSADGTESMTYTVDILFENPGCFVPLYDDRTNMIPDPEMTDVTQYQGWGNKSIAYGFEAYCGLSVMKFDATTNSWPDGAAMDVNDIAWNANSAYRVRFMYKTMDGSLGLLANEADPNFLKPLPATDGEWMEIDTVFHTGASPGTSFLSINNVDASSTAKVAYIDNYELYEVSMDTTLSDLQVDGTTVTGFDAATYSYDVQLAAGTTVVPTVTATTTHVNAIVEVTDATGLPGTTSVLVTAEDGTTTATYEINFTVAVALSTDATLSDLQVDGSTVAGFDPGTLTYDVELPAGTTDVPVVTATTNDVNATAVVTDAADLPGSTVVNVTAEDGTTSATYTVNFTLDTGVGLDPAGAISVYPSVSNGSFTVKTTGHAAEITVYNLYGKLVLQQVTASDEQVITLSQSGMYIMNVKSEGVSKSFKLIKTN